MASSDWTVHIELMGQDRELLERVCENLEWYRKPLQEQAMMQTEREREAMKRGCCLSNFGAFFPPHNFSSNRLRAACGEDKHHTALDGSRQITIPRLYCPCSGS